MRRGDAVSFATTSRVRGPVSALAPPLLSVVIPILNEEPLVGELHARVTAAVAPLGPYEIVVVDDGSTDGTWSRLVELAAVDPHLRLVRLSRNFGHQIALTAGLEAARGDAVVTIDGDLQDPPEVIPDMVARWQEGTTSSTACARSARARRVTSSGRRGCSTG